MEEKALATTNPSALVQIAINQNADIEKLERLMNLQIKWEENEAKKAFHSAMASFKADPPHILKNKKVGFSHKSGGGSTNYSYAPLHSVVTAISEALSKHGLSASWKTNQNDSIITVTCTVTHIGGYSESTSLSAAPDTSGQKNSIQAIGSTISYLERYTILALTGLATSDMDDDGVAADNELITEEQAADIEALITEVKANKTPLLKFFKIKAINELPASRFDEFINILEAKRKQ